MKTKRFTWMLFLFVCAFVCAPPLMAQDPALGEDDFYISASYFINHANFQRHNEGNLSTVPAHWRRDISLDGDYIKVKMGIQTIPADENAHGSKNFVWRSGFQLRNDAAGQGVFKISKEYPVMAIKLGMPKANETLANSNNNFLTEYTWWNPVTAKREKVPVNGLPSNGKQDHVKFFPYIKNHLGGDSLYYFTRTNEAFDPPVMWGGVQVNDPVAESVYFIDFSSAFQEASMVENNIKSFQMAIFGFSCFAVADTLKNLGPATTDPETGVVTSWSYDNVAKTADETPTFRVKWIRGFASQEAFHEFVSQNNGEGPTDYRTDAQRALYEALRKAKKLRTAYSESNYDVVDAFSQEVDAYDDFYTNEQAPNEDPESSEWIAWNDEVVAKANSLAALNSQFVSDLAFTPTEFLYEIQAAADGRWLTFGEDLEVNSITGKQLVFVQNQSNATKFFVTPNGATNDGIPLYTLKANGYYIGMIGSTILAVPEARKGNATINLNFMNRDDSNELYGIGVGNVYANYVNVATGLVSTDEFTYKDTYKFSLEPYTYEQGDDPAGFFEWTFDTPGDIEGWRRNNYRPWIETEQGTYKDLGCLVHKATATYEPNNTTGTQVTAFPTSTGTRREAGSFAGGQYPNEYELSPISDSIKHRLEDYLIVANSGVNRYFAIKAASSNPAVDVAGNSTTGISSFTFYQAFGDGLVLTFDNAIEKRGDVFIFDLLAAGMAPGGIRYVNQYMGNLPLNDIDERVYIDWMRTYETLDAIPAEVFDGNAIPAVNTSKGFFAYGSQGALNIHNYSRSTLKVDLFSVEGRLVKTIQVTGSYATVPVSQGIYIVRAASENGNGAQKVLVK